MADPKSKRRWFLIRMSALLIITALSVAWRVRLDRETREIEREQKIESQIMSSGGRVYFGAGSNDFVGLTPGGTDDNRLELLEKLSQLEAVQLEGTNVTDAMLEHLRGLHRLKRVGLSRCPKITDAGLEQLKYLSQLSDLDLSETQITGVGFEHLRGLRQLDCLRLCGCPRITDAGLEHLKALGQLRDLDLSKTQITIAGIRLLRGLNKLQCIDVTLTQANKKGFEQLDRIFPNQKISWCGPWKANMLDNP